MELPILANWQSAVVWILLVLVTALWCLVAYFVKWHFDNTKKRLDNHSDRLDTVNDKIAEAQLKLAEQGSNPEIARIYDWAKQEVHKLRENEILPLRKEVDDMRSEIHTDIKHIETRMSESLTALRSEIKQDMGLIINLLQRGSK